MTGEDDRTPLLNKQSPKPKRRLTFTGPSSRSAFQKFDSTDPLDSLPFDPTMHSGPDYEVTDALGNLESSANSIKNYTGSHATLRDLRSYDPHNLPSTRPYNRRHSSVKPFHLSTPSNTDKSSRVRSTSSDENPFQAAFQGFNQNSSVSPSFAERWVNRQSRFGGYGSTPIVIDVDKLSSAVGNSSNSTDNHLNVNESDQDFDSKPSSRGSSVASSLDDVCFPLDPLNDDQEGRRVWPDLQVLEEFYEEETTRLKDEVIRETHEANFRFDNHANADEDDNASGTGSYSAGVGFSNPIVTKVDVSASHLLGNQKINETETINGRLRPPKVNPFDKRKTDNAEFLRNINYPPQIVNNNPEHFRFTYFREDLDSTVHSPTISGLLQPGQKFSDLFVADEYARGRLSTAEGRESNHSSSTRLNPQFSSSKANSVREATPSSTLGADLKPLEDFANPPVSSDVESDDHISPFWLDILNPTEEEMKVISKAFSVHPLTTEDIFLGETREKVELFKDYYFVCFRSFDIVQERAKKRKQRVNESKFDNISNRGEGTKAGNFISRLFNRRRQSSAKSINSIGDNVSQTSSFKRRTREIELEKFQRKSGDRHKPKNNELEPLNVYILVFRHAVLTFHFAPTPHPVNVRRRARLLREYLTVSADWIAYALIDDITDAFGPMIESIEDEVNSIEDAILAMNDESDSSDDDSDDEYYNPNAGAFSTSSRRPRQSTVLFDDKRSVKSVSTSSTRSTSSNTLEWRKKGDMLKRIGETRKRVMSLLRLLGSKADVIKGFAKRCNEQWEVAPRSEIGMYLGDIQDHIVTMVQSLNHYEKLLARSHSNYLAQINIDMTKVNNDMNDVLGKITILGTIVLPMNIITGLWGMNVIVPGQFEDGLTWFWCITVSMVLIACSCYTFAKRIAGL